MLGCKYITLRLALILAIPAVSANSENLLSFHTPDKDFEPIEPAPWVYDSAVQGFIDDLKQTEAACRLGVQVIQSSIGMAVYYPLRRDDPSSGLPAERAKALRDIIALAKKNQARIVAAISPYAPANLIKLHPDWLSRPEDNDKVEKDAAADLSKPRVMCFNSPYGALQIETMAEVMKDYGVDGYSCDGGYHPAICYCKSCKELYKKESGRDIPKKVDLKDLEYRIFLYWIGDKLEDWYRKLHIRLREVNPEAAISTWTVNAGRYGHYLTSPRNMSQRMNMLLDQPMQEWWLDELNHGATVIPAFGAAYVHAVTANRTGAAQPYFMSHGNPYNDDGLPGHEILVRSMMGLANGAVIPQFVGYGPRAEAALMATKERSKWLVRTQRIPWAAMLFSEQTRQFYGMDKVEERYLSHPFGIFRVAWEEHLPLSLITDWEVRPETLTKHKVLILPNAACLTAYQVQVIRGYVSAGGGLVASCDTSLFDELGRQRPDFALGDLFGVSFEGKAGTKASKTEIDSQFATIVTEDYWRQHTGIAQMSWGEGDDLSSTILKDRKLNGLVRPGQNVTFKGAQTKVNLTDKLTIVAQMTPQGTDQTLPAMVMRRFGKGRVVYMAAGLDGAYFSYWYPYQRRLLARAVEWAAGEEPAIQVDAPMCVQCNFFEQVDKEGKRLIVHLFNGIDTTSNHGREDIAAPLREESVPVGGIKVVFKGLEVKSLHLEPMGKQLVAVPEGNGVIVEIPPLEIHAMLVAELAGP